jgi:ATP-binding cassette, subfamily B, bacterial
MSNPLVTIGPVVALACAAVLGALVIQRHRREEMPVIVDPDQQIDGGGAASLAIVLAYHGRPVGLAEIRAGIVDAESGGTDALRMVRFAEGHGLVGRGVTIAIPGDLVKMPRGTILHFRDARFVVLEKATDSAITVIDPAVGRRTMSAEEIGASADGVAITFERRR